MSEQTMVEAVGGVIHTGCQEDRDPYDVARDVLTVVSRMTRQSCTPTDDEREALIALGLASYSKIMSDGYPSGVMRTNEEAADLVLAAGFRRSEVPEPSAEDYPDGWFVFGSHAPYPWVGKMEFSAEKDEAGMPLWERPVQGEPSDAQVEAAAQAMFEPDGPGGDYTWAEMVVEDPSRADIWREDARKVLRAAGGAR